MKSIKRDVSTYTEKKFNASVLDNGPFHFLD